MKSKSGDAGRRTFFASDLLAAFVLLCFYQQNVKGGVQASDLIVTQHSNAIISMYNNDACIRNIGCHERPLHILLDVSILTIKFLFFIQLFVLLNPLNLYFDQLNKSEEIDVLFLCMLVNK